MTDMCVQRPKSSKMERTTHLALGWIGMAVSVLAAIAVRGWFEPWVWMWLICVVMFAGMKTLTLLRLDAADWRSLSASRLLGYLFLWPGMKPGTFLSQSTDTSAPRSLLISGLWKALVGLLMFWWLAGWLAGQGPWWLPAWCGMVGFSLFAHFGAFDVLAAFWYARGVPVTPIFQKPLRSASLTEFWGQRWNRAFSDLSRDLLYHPLSRRLGARGALFAVFAFSALAHELAISFPARAGYGLPSAYFLLHGLLVLAEGSRSGRWLLRRRPVLGRIWTTIALLVPAPLLFHAPFLERVVLPFMRALGALP